MYKLFSNNNDQISESSQRDWISPSPVSPSDHELDGLPLQVQYQDDTAAELIPVLSFEHDEPNMPSSSFYFNHYQRHKMQSDNVPPAADFAPVSLQDEYPHTSQGESRPAYISGGQPQPHSTDGISAARSASTPSYNWYPNEPFHGGDSSSLVHGDQQLMRTSRAVDHNAVIMNQDLISRLTSLQQRASEIGLLYDEISQDIQRVLEELAHLSAAPSHATHDDEVSSGCGTILDEARAKEEQNGAAHEAQVPERKRKRNPLPGHPQKQSSFRSP